MRKLVLSILILGIFLAFLGSVSADEILVSSSHGCEVNILVPEEGEWYDPITIEWEHEGNCNPFHYQIQYTEDSCDKIDGWDNIATDLPPISNPQSYKWTDLPGEGDYCIRVIMENIDPIFLIRSHIVDYSGVFHIDLTDPELEIIVGDNHVGCEDDESCYVNTQTPITLECTDDGSGVDYIEYNINDEGWITYEDPFTFSKDSYHTLEARCFDLVGKEDTETKDFIVDTVGPVLDRTVGEPKVPAEEGYYVTEDTEICVSAMNGESEPHPVPGEFTISCEGVKLDENNCFHYTEDSEHTLYCTATDALGNIGSNTWTDFVESQAPITTLTYEGPQYPIENPKYIDGVSTVKLTSDDGQTHPSGPDYTKYRYEQVDESYCLGQGQWETTPKDALDWEVYETPFSMPESCHVVEFYSVDKLGNEEAVKYSFVFVDKTNPTTHKVVGKPNHKCTQGDNQCEADWNYIVTTNTNIDLSCTDNEPHPSGIKELCYQITLDGEPQEETCVPSDKVTVQFLEESEHLLEFYCVDNVNKKSEKDSELFKVEGEQITIELYKKWNLISIPFNLISSDIEEVFDQISNDVEAVWAYKDGEWYVYTPNTGDAELDAPDNLDKIEPGYGYWVKSKESTQLVVGGSLLEPAPGVPPSVPLQKGWNLIGHYGTEEKSVYCSLFSLIDTTGGYPKWGALYSYDAESDKFIPLDAMNPEDKTEPGEGYWIEMDSEDSYSPATTCWGFPLSP